MIASPRARRPQLAALARPRYIQLSGYAQAANCTLALLEGRSQLVVPVVAMVAGSIVQGMNSKGPEYVPADVLANFPESFNGRPIVPVHPCDGTGSANDPTTQSKYRFGQVFNARTDEIDGNLKLDAWLDIERATALGGEPASVVADCQAGRLVQVSLGAWIVMAEVEDGELEDGRKYEYIWQYITSYDHLAMGLAGLEGACSCEMGCGGPRLYTASGEAIPLSGGAPTTPPIATFDLSAMPVLRSNALAKARRPTFSGTETTTWSAPSWHEWVTALHTGTESPKSIADATPALKSSIARHTLLGDPNADNARDLTMFPAVNPHSGRLNEKALRAVLGGRGSGADLPDAAKSSAQTMARALLKSEFDVEIAEPSEPSAETDSESDPKESMNMAVPPTTTEPNAAVATAAAAPASGAPGSPGGAPGEKQRNLLARAFASFSAVIRSLTASATGMSDDTLRAKLWTLLRASEPAFGWGSYYWEGENSGIIDVYQETNTVHYVTRPHEDVLYWIQTYTVGADGVVSLNGDRVRVEYRPVPITASADGVDPEDVTEMPVGEMSATSTAPAPASAPACGCAAAATTAANLSTPATGDPAAASTTETTTLSTGGPSPMIPTPAVRTLVARLVANSGGVFTADSITALEALPEAQLTAMCEKFAPVAVSAADPSHAAGATESAPTPGTTAATVPVAPPEVSANAAAAPSEPEPFDVFLSRAPAEFQSFYADQKAALEARRASLLAAITTKSKAVGTMLAAAPVKDLEAAAIDLGCFTPTPIPSYGAAGLPGVIPGSAGAPAARRYTPPRIYDQALHAMGKPGIGESEAPTSASAAIAPKPN